MTDHGAIAGHIDCPQCQEDRDRAVIARIGGNEYRRRIAPGSSQSSDALDKIVGDAVEQELRNRKASRRAQLPESAFDWPIYRIAINERRYRDPFDSFGAVEGGIEQYQREGR